MRIASVVLTITVALVLQTTLGRFFRGAVGIDLVLVAVIYVALTSGSVTGLFCGAFAGLMQDLLTRVPNSIIGIGGLAKTIVGFLAGVLGTQFIVAQPLPRLVVFLGASVVHAAIFMGLNTVLDLRSFGAPYAEVAGQAVGNAVVGVVTFQLVELLPGAVERRRMAKSRLRR